MEDQDTFTHDTALTMTSFSPWLRPGHAASLVVDALSDSGELAVQRVALSRIPRHRFLLRRFLPTRIAESRIVCRSATLDVPESINMMR